MIDRNEFAVKVVIEILTYLKNNENREIGKTELASTLGYHHMTVRKYIAALEKYGLVRVEPVMNKNVVRLTERGRCIARCLAG